MAIADYSPPVDQLLAYKAPSVSSNDWSGYLNLGITSADIPALIQMIGDESLYLYEYEPDESEDFDEPDGSFYWAAPIHAWRTLAELKAEAAIEPLINVIRRWGDDLTWNEWVNEELPEVFSRIGAVALPALTEYLSDSTQPRYCLETAIRCIGQIGVQHPEQRDRCVAILTHELEAYADRDPSLNAALVTVLVSDFKAVEAAPLIEQAFNATKVDEDFMGNWDEVQVYLGLKTWDEVPRKPVLPLFDPTPRSMERDFYGNPSGFGSRQAGKEKAKRKQQKEARRKNRSKKKK